METSTSSNFENDLYQLFEIYYKGSFRSKLIDGKVILDRCLGLFKRDYKDYFLIDNQGGILSSSYPSHLFIPQQKAVTRKLDGSELNYLFSRARIARCRARFPIPVILFKDKYICRSATLSGGPEIYSRTGFDLFFVSPSEAEETKDLPIFDSNYVFDYARSADIQLLNYLKISLIVDLMVEQKKVKFWLNVTSSEKADKKGRYKGFNILCLPYPGCEFFRKIKNNKYSAHGLTYDWSQDFVDSNLFIPKATFPSGLNINWNDYRSWDILTMTKNYLKLILSSLKNCDESILIHCISGWDRTPLFISLIRLSLWADGLIHEKLNSKEVTYLTLAYDWYLFGHNLSDRISKGEEILFFCFYLLKYIDDPEFSLNVNEECPNWSLSALTNIRPDFEDLVSNLEPDLLDVRSDHASSWSLNSNCSSGSAKSRETSDSTSIGFDEVKVSEKLSQNLGARSNPVEIPSPSRYVEERESETLSRSDSWQFVFYSGSNCDNSFKKHQHSNQSDANFQKSFTQPIRPASRICADPAHKGCQSVAARRTRLQEVRRCFFEAYSSVIFINENKVPLDTLSELTAHFAGALSIRSIKRIKTPN